MFIIDILIQGISNQNIRNSYFSEVSALLLCVVGIDIFFAVQSREHLFLFNLLSYQYS